jgi:hypothetical protein
MGVTPITDTMRIDTSCGSSTTDAVGRPKATWLKHGARWCIAAPMLKETGLRFNLSWVLHEPRSIPLPQSACTGEFQITRHCIRVDQGSFKEAIETTAPGKPG